MVYRFRTTKEVILVLWYQFEVFDNHIMAITGTSYVSFEIMSNANREFQNVSVPNLQANIQFRLLPLKPR